jgi:MYXO-CTERM domain-containing protein
MRAVVVLVLLGAALACMVTPSARADGDPASDYLITQKVFFPYDLKVARAKQLELASTVDEANRAGFPIRVALVWSGYDLGSITGLWQKPQLYARFLGAELKYVYKNRLLIVMPNGFGFNRPGHSSASEYAVLTKIPIKPGQTGFVDSSLAAVRALAKASGVTLSTTAIAPPSSSSSHDRIVIVLGATAALAVAVLLRLALRRRRRR